MTTISPSPLRVMKIGSSDVWARSEISLALFRRSEIDLMSGIASSKMTVAILYHLYEKVKNGALQLTGVTTTLPLLIGAVEAMLKATVVVAQRFCSPLVCGCGRKGNDSLIAALAASFSN